MAEVARGSLKAGSRPRAFMSASKRAISSAARSRKLHAELAGLAQDVVVDVGDVAHALGVVAQVAQPALQHVVGQVGGGVAQVGGVVRGDAAGVHRDQRAGLERDQRLPGRVVEAHCHHYSRLMP